MTALFTTPSLEFPQSFSEKYRPRTIADNVGKLTREQTAEVLKECINALPDDLLIEILSENLTMEQVDELVDKMP